MWHGGLLIIDGVHRGVWIVGGGKGGVGPPSTQDGRMEFSGGTGSMTRKGDAAVYSQPPVLTNAPQKNGWEDRPFSRRSDRIPRPAWRTDSVTERPPR